MIWNGSSHKLLIFRVKKGQLSKLLLNRPFIMAVYALNLYQISSWLFWRLDSAVTLRHGIHPLRMPSVLSIRSIRPFQSLECYLLRLAYKVTVMALCSVTDIYSIKACKIQGKKRLTSNCLTAYLIWANTSYNTIDGVIVLF